MTYDEYIIDSKELCHFGIKGMRWGIRRYQNTDGSLTNAGRKRYSDQSDSRRIETAPRIRRYQDTLRRLSKRYQNEDGSLTDSGKRRYVDQDTGELTRFAKKKLLKKNW